MNKLIDMKTLLNKLENISEGRFEDDVAEERSRSVSSLAHIIASEVNDILRKEGMPNHSAFAQKTIDNIVNVHSDQIKQTIRAILEEE